MKTQYKILFLLFLCLGISSCNSDDNDKSVDTSNLIELEQSEVRIKLQEVPENPIEGEEDTEEPIAEDINSVSVAILSGNGDYSAFSLNEKVATATYSEEKNAVVVNAKRIGKANIVVLDKNIESTTLKVSVFENENIILKDVEGDLNFELKRGERLDQTYNIEEGNGGFVAKSSNEEIVKAEVTFGKMLKLTTPNGAVDGEATITIIDQCDVKLELKVTITTTVIPYNETELENLKLIDNVTFRFNNATAVYDYKHTNLISEEGENTIGVTKKSYWGKNEKVLIYFKGERDIRIVEDAEIESENYNGLTFEGKSKLSYMNIFHKTDKLFYASFSYLDKDNILRFGYFVAEVTPA